MNYFQSLSEYEFATNGRIFIRRALDSEELCVSMENYHAYCDRYNLPGLCFGTALCWVSHSLRDIKENPLPFNVGQTGVRFYDLGKFDDNFFYFSAYVQKAYTEIVVKTKSLAAVVQSINAQEKFLSYSAKSTSSVLHYSWIVDDRMAQDILQSMLLNYTGYKNTAMLLSTSVEDSSEKERYFHTTALINYNGKLFFFDANKGIYHIFNPHKLHWLSFLTTITEGSGMSDELMQKYVLDTHSSIFVTLSK
ncbi:hypothetical protein [Enterobacter sp. Bisph1]|uniref:hypothetical protein n=1 Tax=Enterobacter sp. Bisph1 TaxID=1274399 RepID=UPI00057BD8D7|nr:hypothetical protein [Enterobacter sp. Bisph1]